MTDIILGIIILGLLSLLLFFTGRWIGRKLPIWGVYICAIATVLLIGCYIRWLWDNVLLAQFLPFSNLIVVGNWFPLLLSLFGGMVCGLIPRLGVETRDFNKGLRIRQALVLVITQGIGWYAVVQPLLGTVPICTDNWEGRICLQTTSHTCSAACAATLLKECGIETNEQEMANLCLTRRGTLWQGLYRGLKLKTAGTDWDVEVFSGTADDLKNGPQTTSILMVGIPTAESAPPIYSRQYGWIPGVFHSVLFFRFLPGGNIHMGEPTPTIVEENWSEEDLRILYRRRGVRLVKRAGR